MDLGPRADADPLAREIRRRIVANLERGGRLAAFRRMWGTVVLVAVSEERGGTLTHTTLTLRFDWGRLMIHEGRVGRPDVTLWGSPEAILRLGAWGRLPSWSTLKPWGERSGRADASTSPASKVGGVLGKMRRSSHDQSPRARLRVYGGRSRPRFLWRLARLLA